MNFCRRVANMMSSVVNTGAEPAAILKILNFSSFDTTTINPFTTRRLFNTADAPPDITMFDNTLRKSAPILRSK
eukprot:CAMPEP_0170194840 /NCGR_PEP_ID=MMETSP0040_2-20121228/60138_1 /TAXON_ID=641309 /ORGANISM="Lotharella oceanica, Strain CCMP622" /LENGTH=73 /DNA_ID=CAMNT_0010443853 /DNA_START=97 /DNA_END=318 /DNA_ORIENTATION=+